MKIVFLLGSPDVGGGTYVIFQHALKCLEKGNDVTIVTDEEETNERIKWHKGAEKLVFNLISLLFLFHATIILSYFYKINSLFIPLIL